MSSDQKTRPWQGIWASVRRFWPYTRPHSRYIWISLLFTLMGVPLSLISPLLIKRVIDLAGSEGAQRKITFLALTLAGMTVLTVAFGVVIGYCNRIFHNKVSYNLRLKLFLHVQQLSLSFHRSRETGYLISRLDHDVDNLGGIMADALGNAVIEVLKAAGFLILLFTLEPRLAFGGCLLVVVVFGVQLVISRPLRRRNKDLQESKSLLSQILHQGISGHYLVQSTASELREGRRFAGGLGRMIRAAVRRDLFALWANHAMSLITGVAPTLIILAGAFLIVDGKFSVGGLFAFFIVLVQMAGSVAAVARLNPSVQASVASVQRIFEILDTIPEIRQPDSAHHLGDLRGEVEFVGVQFAYEPGRPVLRDINVVTQPNTMVALVGPSGAGKTTFVNLIPRFYDPVQGHILVDGQDLRQVALRGLRSQIGIVPQDIFLFDRSVRDNITFGSPQATDEAVREAIQAANALDFVQDLPEGLDTIVGERGVRLSGGQRQRLAIAREILRNPTILILDEATSSLDTESERLIQEALATLLKNRTSFVIAHRLSTVISADIILVLEGGRIVERGTHTELLAGAGLYARLCRAQAFVSSGMSADSASRRSGLEP